MRGRPGGPVAQVCVYLKGWCGPSAILSQRSIEERARGVGPAPVEPQQHRAVYASVEAALPSFVFLNLQIKMRRSQKTARGGGRC